MNRLPPPNKTHGLSNTPEYQTWNNMMRRCHMPNAAEYVGYGAKGIFVCARWEHSLPRFWRTWANGPLANIA